MIFDSAPRVSLILALTWLAHGCVAREFANDEVVVQDDEFSTEEAEPCFDYSDELVVPGEVCAVTPTNLVAYLDDLGELVIARIEASGSTLELVEIGSYESHGGCGELAHDEVGDRMWLLDGGGLNPLYLRALDGAGALAWEQELPSTFIPSLLAHERDVLISGAVEDVPDTSYLARVVRLDVDGNEVWSRSGYVEASEDPDRPMSNLEMPARAGSEIVFLASQWGIDSAAVSLVAIDPDDGASRWHELLTPDDYTGPRYALGGDGERAYLTVVREPQQLDPDNPATVEVIAYAEGGAIEWMTEQTWPGGYQIDAMPVIRGGDELYLSTLGLSNADQPDGRQIAYSLEGVVRCTRGFSMTELRGRTVLPDGRYALLGESQSESTLLVVVP